MAEAISASEGAPGAGEEEEAFFAGATGAGFVAAAGALGVAEDLGVGGVLAGAFVAGAAEVSVDAASALELFFEDFFVEVESAAVPDSG